MVGTNEQDAAVPDLAHIGPVAGKILPWLAGADDMGDDLRAEFFAQTAGRIDPALPSYTRQHGEFAMAGEIERRNLLAGRGEEPGMRQPRAGPARLLAMQFRVLGEYRFGLSIGDRSTRAIALVHLDPMAIELVDLVGDRLADRGALLLGGDSVVAAGVHVLLHLHRVDGIEQSERLEDRPEFLDRLVGAGDYLLGNRRALGLIAVEKFRACGPSERRRVSRRD